MARHRTGGRASAFLGFALLAMGASASAQSLRVVTVPWLGDPNQPHQVFDNGNLILQAVVTEEQPGCSLTSATWDPGDGSGPVAVSFANPRVIELEHTYTGAPGTPYVATVTVQDSCGNTSSDTFRVVMRTKTLDVEVNMAIDHGLWELNSRMTYSTSGGVDTGYWSSNNQAAATASGAQAFLINGHLEGNNPLEDPYVDTVRRAMAHTMTELSSIAIAPQTAGDPDVNGNGIGLEVLDGNDVIYVGGQLMDAIAATRTPNAVATTGDATWVLGRTYKDILQDMVDAYSWGQVDSGTYQGSWRYIWNSSGDNSAAQWWAIGVIPAEANPWNCVVPQFVKDENVAAGNFLLDSQIFDGSNAGNDGRWGYSSTNPINVNGMNTTPSGLVQLNADDVPSTDPRHLAAQRFMVREWTQLTNGNSVYGMFATAKAMRLSLPQPIQFMSGFPGTDFDWYRSELALGDQYDGLARYLVDNQQSSDLWGGSQWVGTGDLASAWAIIILSPTITDPPPIAVCDADPEVTGVNVTVNFDGSSSFHTDPAKNIISWEWDFEGDGTFDATGPMASTSYPTLGTYNAVLRVTDDGTPPLQNTTSCQIQIIPPPIPPDSDPGGPYIFCETIAEPFILDGSGSSDADGNIVSWEWDFTPQPLNQDFADAAGQMVDVTAVFKGFGPGVYDVALRVTDNDGGTNVDFTTVQVFSAADCPNPNIPPSFDAPTPCGQTIVAGVGTPLSIQVCASDPSTAESVTIMPMGSLPPGAMWSGGAAGNPSCGTLDYVAQSADAGNSFVVTFVATDSVGRSTTCAVTLEVAECHLLLATSEGDETYVTTGYEFQTQLGEVKGSWPVTMTDYPTLKIHDAPKDAWVGEGYLFPTDSTSQSLFPNERTELAVQIVMYNPQVFPTNPEQHSQVCEVIVLPSGQIVTVLSGDKDGINISANIFQGARGDWFVEFPFTIDGL